MPVLACVSGDDWRVAAISTPRAGCMVVWMNPLGAGAEDTDDREEAISLAATIAAHYLEGDCEITA